MAIPTSALRHDLLGQCVRWMAEHPTERNHRRYRAIVCSTLDVPSSKQPLRPSDFQRSRYDLALGAYREIAELGTHLAVYGWPETPEAVLARAAREHMERARSQRDLTTRQMHDTHVEAMVLGLIEWLTFIPGGLADAAYSLVPHPRDQFDR